MGMELMELERRLIGFDTIRANSNLALVDFLADYLKGLDMDVAIHASEEIHQGEVRVGADGVKANQPAFQLHQFQPHFKLSLALLAQLW